MVVNPPAEIAPFGRWKRPAPGDDSLAIPVGGCQTLRGDDERDRFSLMRYRRLGDGDVMAKTVQRGAFARPFGMLRFGLDEADVQPRDAALSRRQRTADPPAAPTGAELDHGKAVLCRSDRRQQVDPFEIFFIATGVGKFRRFGDGEWRDEPPREARTNPID